MTFPAKRRSKYNARRVYLDGHQFDSIAESKHYILLKHRQRMGEIAGLELHPKFQLIVNGFVVGTYTGDFGFFDCALGMRVVDERKGVRARDFALRSKLFQALYPNVELRINGKAIRQRQARAA